MQLPNTRVRSIAAAPATIGNTKSKRISNSKDPAQITMVNLLEDQLVRDFLRAEAIQILETTSDSELRHLENVREQLDDWG